VTAILNAQKSTNISRESSSKRRYVSKGSEVFSESNESEKKSLKPEPSNFLLIPIDANAASNKAKSSRRCSLFEQSSLE